MGSNAYGLTIEVYKYSSEAELNSSRFTGPGDFFIYIMFVGTVILVSTAQFFRFL